VPIIVRSANITSGQTILVDSLYNDRSITTAIINAEDTKKIDIVLARGSPNVLCSHLSQSSPRTLASGPKTPMQSITMSAEVNSLLTALNLLHIPTFISRFPSNPTEKIPNPAQNKKPSSHYTAWENSLHPTKYSTFASIRVKESASYEDRTNDLLQETLQSLIANGVVLPDWANLPIC
jgi:hypothetical protein